MLIKDITKHIENTASLDLQESYDNAGLIIGNYNDEVKGALLCIDVTEEVVDEAINKKAGLIISHHPIVFKGLKRFNGTDYVQRTVMKAIQNNIAIYSAHTNLDNAINGVNSKICEILNLQNKKILKPLSDTLSLLTTYVPSKHAAEVSQALFSNGAGTIGNYDSCSFQSEGNGTFRAGQNTNPFVGKVGEMHAEAEIKIEVIVPQHILSKTISSMIKAHPYEEVVYNIHPVKNKNPQTGAGMIGELEHETDTYEFLDNIKKTFGCKCIRHTEITKNKIKKVAVCGGSGSFLLKQAIASKADIFITGDFKYHEFFDAEGKTIIADIGHYESEQFTKDLFFDILNEKLFNFALYKSTANTNPIKYY